MKKQDFRNIIMEQFGSLNNLTSTKGEEYARSDDDQLANFKRQAMDLGIPMEKVLLVYLNKHMDSIRTYIKSVPFPEPLSEPIESRIDDAILYLILLRAMVVERQYVADPDGYISWLNKCGNNDAKSPE